ncbi:MAG: hypothetical protein GXY33_00205 [Phycisphaerae bacterium]|nr:hypothetical protein [Phycisphaerae bacterium]
MRLLKSLLAMLLLSAVFVAIPSCEREEGPVEEAGEKIDEGIEETGEAIEDAGEGR